MFPSPHADLLLSVLHGPLMSSTDVPVKSICWIEKEWVGGWGSSVRSVRGADTATV